MNRIIRLRVVYTISTSVTEWAWPNPLTDLSIRNRIKFSESLFIYIYQYVNVTINIYTYCVRKVNAALVIELGKLRPFVTSRHNFLLMTSTRPPFPTTKRNNSSIADEENQSYLSIHIHLHKSRTCFAIIGIRLTGVPLKEKDSIDCFSQVYNSSKKKTRTNKYFHSITCQIWFQSSLNFIRHFR